MNPTIILLNGPQHHLTITAPPLPEINHDLPLNKEEHLNFHADFLFHDDPMTLL
jgi:hypothetical protein